MIKKNYRPGIFMVSKAVETKKITWLISWYVKFDENSDIK